MSRLALIPLLFLPFCSSDEIVLEGGQRSSEDRKAIAVVETALKHARSGDSSSLESLVGGAEICRYLLDSEYEKAPGAERDRFCTLIKGYILQKLPAATSYLKNASLQEVQFGKPSYSGNQAMVDSAYKSYRLTWVLTKRKTGKYVITDYLRDGKSGMQSNRDSQVQPGLKRYGLKGLNDKLEKSVSG